MGKKYITIVDNDLYDNEWMSDITAEYDKNIGTSFWKDSFSTDSDVGAIVHLSKYLKAIHNFVKIMTCKDNINVVFSGNDSSYTDGKTVTISSDVSDDNFDSTVGLALHESSHILKTNMVFFQNIKNSIDQNEAVIKKLMEKYGETDSSKIKNFMFFKIKDLTNFIEDRRIDDFVYKTCPGYMVYYRALYSKYYLHQKFTEILNGDSYVKENWNSYMFRTILLMNQLAIKTQDKLKNLKPIYDLVDLKNISRLSSVKDSYKLALEIFTIIENSVDPEDIENETESDTKQQTGDGAGINKNSDKNGNYDSDSTGSDSDLINISDGDLSGLSPADKEELKKLLKSLNGLINGTLSKKTLNDTDKETMRIIEKSNITFHDVGENKHRRCIFIKKLTMELINAKLFKNIFTKSSYEINSNQRIINTGIQRGILLGKQLKIRTEKKELKFSRLTHGKIDKHLLHELGFKDNGVFYKQIVDKYNDAYMHITVDASISMSGSKWNSTLQTVVTMAKAISMITGIHLTISFRNTVVMNQIEYPFIILAYDSKVDSLTKIQTLFKYLRTDGCTPEGLVFETLMNIFPTDNILTNKYFLNFSDGMPYCNQFSGNPAIDYTRLQVKKIQSQGVEIISYYLSDGYDGNTCNDFKRMYGKNSEVIDLSSITKIARTINYKFLKK